MFIAKVTDLKSLYDFSSKATAVENVKDPKH